jgi:hypothetical protein
MHQQRPKDRAGFQPSGTKGIGDPGRWPWAGIERALGALKVGMTGLSRPHHTSKNCVLAFHFSVLAF